MNSISEPVSQAAAPLVVHIIYQLGVGGLENGLVNLINTMPAHAYRHAIVCLKNSTDFQQRLTSPEVKVYSLNKQEGQGWASFIDFYRLLRQLKPAILHTRNLSTIEYQLPAVLAGVKHRVHGEHGWDVFDPDGNNVKYQWVRRVMKSFIHRFIPLSRQLENYLLNKIQVAPQKITRICNGVDTEIFYPAPTKTAPQGCPFTSTADQIVIGTVGRMHGVKDQLTLVKAFITVCQNHPEFSGRLKLCIAGDGPLRAEALALLQQQQLAEHAWLPGERKDVAEFMRSLDIFILPSLAEGISNTILEAMATGLPVIATAVGGNPELVDDGNTGLLTPPGDHLAMAEKILEYLNHPQKRLQHGQQGRARVMQDFSLQAMVSRYQAVYDSFLKEE